MTGGEKCYKMLVEGQNVGKKIICLGTKVSNDINLRVQSAVLPIKINKLENYKLSQIGCTIAWDSCRTCAAMYLSGGSPIRFLITFVNCTSIVCHDINIWDSKLKSTALAALHIFSISSLCYL